MKCDLLVFVLICLPYVYGDGFFSKLFSGGKREAPRGSEDFVDVCETVKVMPRIALAVVGGAPLKSENSAPYIAAVGERLSNGSVSWFCGGSLISPQDVLTAAHCLISRNVTTVRVGSFSTKKRSTEDDYEIGETIIHPGYKITQSYHDIAIIKLKDKIQFSSNIKPVCLPQDESDKYEKERAKVIGWGAEEFGGEGTHKLQQVEVEVFTNSNCEKAYTNSTIAPKTFPKGITKEQLCAGSSRGGKDACQGDSGGPLVLTDENGIVRLIGIVSTGAGCGFKAYPGVYSRVSSYTDWIQQQIKKTGSSGSRPGTEQTSQNKISGNGHSSRHTEETSNRPPQSTHHSQKKDDRNNGEANLLNSNINLHTPKENSRERYSQDNSSQQSSNGKERQSSSSQRTESKETHSQFSQNVRNNDSHERFPSSVESNKPLQQFSQNVRNNDSHERFSSNVENNKPREQFSQNVRNNDSHERFSSNVENNKPRDQFSQNVRNNDSRERFSSNVESNKPREQFSQNVGNSNSREQFSNFESNKSRE